MTALLIPVQEHDLRKSAPDEAFLTEAQRARVDELIELHHYALIVELLGDRAVAKSTIAKLKVRGLYRKPRSDLLRRAYQLGLEGVFRPDVLRMSVADFESYIANQGDKVPTETLMTLRAIRESFASHLGTLAKTMRARVSDTVTKADKQLVSVLANKQRRELFLELARRKALAKIAKDLGDTTKILASNASRTIDTETNNAFQSARAMEIIRKSGQRDPLVFKVPRHDACEDCVRAYLKGDRKTPRVFRMSRLLANGSNIGKSNHERLPVLESYHPWCACQLFWLPPGYSFDETGTMVQRGT